MKLCLILLAVVTVSSAKILTGSSGTISSPKYPNNYPNNAAKRWIIQSSGDALNFHFNTNFNIESYDTYCFDDVRFMTTDQQANDVCGYDSELLNDFCGSTAPADFSLPYGDIIVEFCSDYSVRSKGFSLDWSTTAVPTGSPTQPPTKSPTGDTESPTQAPTGSQPTEAPFNGQCGQQAAGYEPIDVDGTRIVGGETAKAHSWPWQVSFMKDYGSEWLNYCGGTLVNNRFVVTAGHCFHDVTEADWPSFYLKLGAQNRGTDNTANEDTQQVVKIEKAIVHPQYDAQATSHDVTVIKLDRDVTLNDFVRPVCIASSTDTLAAGTNVVVTGWGTTVENGDEPEFLQQVVVPIVSNTQCNTDYNGAIDDTMICAGNQAAGGVDSCQGDSGGPLVQKHSDGKWYLEGIVSWGEGCAEAGYPGVYSRVAALESWIEQTITSNT